MPLPAAGRIRQLLLSIDPREATFARRRFAPAPEPLRLHLEAIGSAFITGYNAGLAEGEARAIADRLAWVPTDLRGFAFEGAGMAYCLLDGLSLRKKARWQRFLSAEGASHPYMAHVGAGWALARLPGPLRRRLSFPDPLLRWLVVDGLGFHQGYFAPAWRPIESLSAPGLTGYQLRAFDQGVGRSLWFRHGADPFEIARAIGAAAPGRRADLWSGVGLAAAYAGGAERKALEALRLLAHGATAELALGAAFAAKARERAGLPAPHTGLACEVFTGRSAADAARATDDALTGLPADGELPAYEVWRSRIRAVLGPHPDESHAFVH